MLTSIRTEAVRHAEQFTNSVNVVSGLKNSSFIDPLVSDDHAILLLERRIVEEVNGVYTPLRRSNATMTFGINPPDAKKDNPNDEYGGRHTYFSPIFLINLSHEGGYFRRQISQTRQRLDVANAEDIVSRLPDWALTAYIANVYMMDSLRGQGWGTELLKESLPFIQDLYQPYTHYSPLCATAITQEG